MVGRAAPSSLPAAIAGGDALRRGGLCTILAALALVPACVDDGVPPATTAGRDDTTGGPGGVESTSGTGEDAPTGTTEATSGGDAGTTGTTALGLQTDGTSTGADPTGGGPGETTGEVTTGTTGEPPPPLLPACEAVPKPCPGGDDDHLVRHGGLVAGERCQFELVDQDTWADRSAILDAIAGVQPEVDIATVIADTNRVGVALQADEPALTKLVGLHAAFKWDATDTGVQHWMPQGVTGSWDASPDGLVGGRNVVAVSWYYKPEATNTPSMNKGVRVSLADVTDIASGTVRYRHVLLVEPFMDGDTPSYRAVKIHAGGISWVGRYLYVVDTVKGLRVFDTERLFKIANLEDRIGHSAETGLYHGYGYSYVMPQVGAYFLSDASCWHRFSYVSFDRTSNPPSLITGEYYDTHIAGKLVRWPLAGDTMMAAEDEPGVVHPLEVFFQQEKVIQGAVSSNGRWWLSGGSQLNMSAVLFRTGPDTPSDVFPWLFGPEDLMYVHGQDILWSASEFAGKRYVWAVDVASYPQ